MTTAPVGRYIAYALVSLALIVALGVGGAAGCKGYNRYQKRADAENQVKVTAIQIKNQEQRVLIAQQTAQIRKQEAIGIRAAQDEIAKTLTPLYVAHEMTQAMEKIATSGTNNTVVYVPTNPATGLPIVPTTASTKP